MALKSYNPTKTEAWKKISDNFNQIKDLHMSNWFIQDKNRAEKFSIQWEDFYLDFSKNRINDYTLKYFTELLDEIELGDAINKYFSGDRINFTEDRSALHTQLRSKNDNNIFIDDQNIYQNIHQTNNRIKSFSDSIINGNKKGYSNLPFQDIVNIGIGGSDLGPAMVVDSLRFYKNHLNTHFVSNVDGDYLQELLSKLNPETTLFIIVSKSFTTHETITNANKIRNWFLKSAKEKDIEKHFMAVTSNNHKAISFGICQDNIFPIWDWVGGRFSLWSAAGLSISLSIGYNNFNNLLSGAHDMDKHFKETSFDKNMPVMLACISVWYNNFFNCETEAIIPYSNYLEKFRSYLQQVSMESNGKKTDREGNFVNYQTGQIIWGEPGTNSQHSFFQLLHQGTKLIPIDFIGFSNSLHGNNDNHNILMANFFAQTKALLEGNSKTTENLHNDFKGNIPTNTILIEKLTPSSIGKLIAMYEHKIFVQGIIWNIFSFDQFGVELGKTLATDIYEHIKSKSKKKYDCSTDKLISHYNQSKQ